LAVVVLMLSSRVAGALGLAISANIKPSRLAYTPHRGGANHLFWVAALKPGALLSYWRCLSFVPRSRHSPFGVIKGIREFLKRVIS
jgi:hypothetical protein